METLSQLLRTLMKASLIRYGIIGVGAAGTHAATAIALKFLLSVPPTLSNFAGFLVGGLVSYLGSYYFTFRTDDGHKKSLPRFALVWIIGIAINVGLFKWMLETFDVPFAINVFIAIVLTPIAQYLMLRFWAFKK